MIKNKKSLKGSKTLLADYGYQRETNDIDG